jgi:hypothetical protein
MFPSHFLQARYGSVRLGIVLSVRYPEENGVPQGSVLRVTLFAISIDGLVNAVGPSVTTSLYVDDVAIYFSSRSMGTMERKLQGATYRLSRCARENGFAFSPDKTKSLHVTRLMGLYPDPCLPLKDRVRWFVPTLEFLGLILDSKLSWEPHMR